MGAAILSHSRFIQHRIPALEIVPPAVKWLTLLTGMLRGPFPRPF